MPRKLYAQGDIVLELVEDASPSKPLSTDADHVVALARGELTGHAHAFYRGGVTLFRDEALARELPPGFYIGQVKISRESADLRHEEHATVTLPGGTYRVRRRREWDSSGDTLLLWE